MILVESEQVVQMKEANVIAPYVFKRVSGSVIIPNTFKHFQFVI